MRIAHFMVSSWNSDLVRLYVLRLAAAQEQAGHHVVVFELPAPHVPMLPGAVEVHGVADLLHRARTQGFDVLHTHVRLPVGVRQRGPAIVRTIHDHSDHCPSLHKHEAWMNTPCQRSQSLAGCMAGYLAAGCGVGVGAGAWVRRLWGLSQRRAERSKPSPWMVASSDYLKSQLLASGAKVAEMPVLHLPAPSRGAVAALAGGVPRFVYEGPLEARQGVLDLIEALRAVSVRCELDILGDGPLRAALERRIQRLDLEHRVCFVPDPDPDVRARLYQGARAVVAPLRWPDPVPWALLEAAAYGRAVIATRVGCHPELVEDGVHGTLFSAGSIQELAQALEEACLHPARMQHQGAMARAMAETRLSLEDHTATLLGLYERAVAQVRLDERALAPQP